MSVGISTRTVLRVSLRSANSVFMRPGRPLTRVNSVLAQDAPFDSDTELAMSESNGSKGGARTPIAFRLPDPKSGASASSATFAQTAHAHFTNLPTYQFTNLPIL